jgi:tRNA(fMet)-specific endonuclease VapC
MTRSGSSDRLVVDTSAYSHFRAGHPEAIDCLARAAAIILPTIVLGELEAAFRLGSRERENRHALDELLVEPFVAVQPVNVEVSREYGEIFAALRRAGTPIPVNDIWIAACARSTGATLLTFDRDFERIPELRCRLLRPLENG